MSLPISHVMRTKIVSCEVSSNLRKVAEIMLKEKVGSVLVNQGEEHVGMITMDDLIRGMLKRLDFDKAKAGEIMSHPLETCGCEQDLDYALKKFEKTGHSRLVVKKGDKVVGILKKTIAQRFRGVRDFYTFSPKTHSLPFRRGSGSSIG